MQPAVVADAGPLRYLVVIEQITLLHTLFDAVAVPHAVVEELSHPSAPQPVRDWLRMPPPWLRVTSAGPTAHPEAWGLDKGEAAALELALDTGATLVLTDDRRAAAVARRLGFEVMGTLAILVRASRRGLIALRPAFDRLKGTNFRRSEALLEAILEQEEGCG